MNVIQIFWNRLSCEWIYTRAGQFGWVT